MGDIGLTNGSQERPGSGLPKDLDEGRSATVMLPLPPHPEGEASVVWLRLSRGSPGVAEEPETFLSVKLLALAFYFRRGLSTFCWLESNLKVSRKE